MGIEWSKTVLVAVLFVFLSATTAESDQFERVDAGSRLDVFVWRDVVNVFVLRSEESAILVGLGDALQQYEQKLRRLARLYIRGYLDEARKFLPAGGVRFLRHHRGIR